MNPEQPALFDVDPTGTALHIAPTARAVDTTPPVDGWQPPPVTVHHGDCLDVLRGMPDSSVDAVVTDPPYGLEFMGKEWDRFKATGSSSLLHSPKDEGRTFTNDSGHMWDNTKALPRFPGAGLPFQQWCQLWATECLRVLKPGGHLLAFGGTRTYHRLAAGIEDAGFEIRDSLHWIYGCLSEDSEALTRRGWVRGADLRPDDEIAQWDDGALSWVRPQRITVAPYRGPVVNLRNRHTDQILTPNHRVYAKVRTNPRNPPPASWTVTEAADLRPSWQVTLPMSGVLDDGKPVDPDYAYLVGWWLTDAWRHRDGKAVMFSQCKPATLAKLRDALAPHQPSEYVKRGRLPQHADEHTFYVTGELARQLIAEWPDRRLRWSVLDWDAPARRRLLDGLIDGDGSHLDGQHGVVFWSQNRERRDIVAALFTTLGWRVLVDDRKGAVHANPRGSTQLQKRHRDAAPPVDYDGLVWCVTVPAGAFVARRNGHPFITGNSGFPKSLDVSKAIDKAAATPDAQRWQGWGTALKPAHEPVVVARKPLDGTVAGNVLAHGVGGLNIDGCRVGTGDDRVSGGNAGASTSAHVAMGGGWNGGALDRPSGGRWPSNVVFTHHPDCEQTGERRVRTGTAVNNVTEDATYAAFNCHPECPVHELDTQSGTLTSGALDPSRITAPNKTYGARPADLTGTYAADTGGASRFFPVFRYQAKAPAKERPRVDGAASHPTVKPLALMRWLVRLVTPPGGVVLDPFAGSGTTAEACQLERVACIAIEREADYLPLIHARLQRNGHTS